MLCVLQEVYNELGTLEPRVDSLLQNGEALVQKSSGTAANTLKQNRHNLQTRWDNIRTRAEERKVRLIISEKLKTRYT